MKSLLFILPFIVIVFFAKAQHKTPVKKNAQHYSLVANGSFEDINVCTEFKANCEPEGWFFLPSYIMEPQGNDSNRYEVLSMTNLRFGGRTGNYLFTKLLCPLQENKRYTFSIWVLTPRNSFHHLDVYFTFLEPTNHLALNTVTEPSFTVLPKHQELNMRLWKKYAYNYIATGEERYLTIGNFSNELWDKSSLIANNKEGDVFYLIDNIALNGEAADGPPCESYYAVAAQVYNQNYRHPARMIDKILLDSSLLTGSKRSLNFTPTGKKDTLTIPDILFQSNSSNINPAFKIKLDGLINNMNMRRFHSIDIIGHTDSIGNDQLNNQLSYQRANAIRQYIIGKIKVPEKLITATGAGKSQPKAGNNTPEGRKINRRVEIILNE